MTKQEEMKRKDDAVNKSIDYILEFEGKRNIRIRELITKTIPIIMGVILMMMIISYFAN